MLKRLFPVIILCFIYSQYLYSQSDPLDQILTNLQVEETEIAEWLQILTEQPVNINGASKVGLHITDVNLTTNVSVWGWVI